MPQSVDGDIRLSASFKLNTDNVKQQAKQLKQSLDNILSSKDTRGNPKFEKLAKQLQKSYFSVEKLQKELQEAEDAKVPTESYKRLQDEIEKTRQKLVTLETEEDKWSHATGAGKYLAKGELEKIRREADEVSEALSRLRQQEKQLISSGGAFTVDDSKISGIAQQLAFATQNGEQLKNKFEEVKSKAENIAESPSRLGKAFEVAKVAVSAFGKIAKTAFEGGKKGARVFGNTVKAAVGVAKRAISGLKSALDRVKTGFSSLKDSAKKAFEHADKSASKGLKNLLRYGLGIRGLFMLFRKLRGYATDAFKGIAQQSSSFNKTMSNITNTFGQFKNSIGTALQPLITIVEPVLIRIMELFINAANAVGSFFATLTGQKYIYKAVKANNSYADSVSGTGKAAKEARKELAAYDKLMVISSQDAEDAAGGGSGGGGGFTEELVDPTNSVSKFAQDLKDAWESQDFKAIGEIVGNKINEVVQKIDDAIKWENVGPKVEEFTKNFGTAFNSLVDTVDWENIGKTVADGLNTITYSIDSFLKNFDIDKLGTALGEAFNGLNDNVDWKAMGKTVADGLNEITSTINNFQDTGNWKEVGANFASALNSLVDGVDGEALGKALSAKLKIMLDAANGFVHEFKWEDAGKKLSDVFEGWFDNIDFEGLGDTVATGLNGIAKTINNFANSTDWDHIGDKIGSAFSTLVDNIDAEEIGSALAAPFESINKTIRGFLDNFEKNDTWKDAGKKIGQTINSWFNSINWETAAANLTDGIDGIVDTIKSALETVHWDEIGKKLATLLGGVFKVDWENIGATGSELAGDLLEFFTSAVENIEWAQIGQDIVDFFAGIEWGDLFKKSINLLDRIGEGIGLILKGAWNAAIDHLLEKDMPGWLRSMLEGLKFDEQELQYQTDRLFTDIDDSIDKSSKKHSGNGGKFEVPVEVSIKGDMKSLDELFKNFQSKDVTLQAEAKEKIPGALKTLKNDWDEILDKHPELSAEAKEKVKGALADLQKNWDNINNKDPVLAAEAKEKVNGALATLKTTWDGIKDKDATAKLNAEKGQNFDSNKKAYDDLGPKSAKAELLAEKGKNFDSNKKSYDDLGSKSAKAELLAEKNKNFDATKKEYDKVKDKKVTVTAGLGDSVQKTASGWWSKIVSYYKSSDKYKAAGGKLPVGATAPADKSKVATWWNSIKSWWGSHTLGMTGSVTDVSLTDKAKGQLKTSLQLYLPQKPNAKQPEYRAARGGVFTSPSRVYLGENGPEAVVPLKNHTEWLDIVSKYVTAHLNLGKLDIPHLAKGSVIPPNRQFLAMLGDQKYGTNVETPLKTIEQALENVINRLGRSGGNQAPIILQLDGKQIAKVVWSESDKRYKQTGKSYA